MTTSTPKPKHPPLNQLQPVDSSAVAVADAIIKRSTLADTYGSKSTLVEVRILRDYANQDGWITKRLDSDQVAFIANLSATIQQLAPGQVWLAKLLTEGDRYSKVQLLSSIAD